MNDELLQTIPWAIVSANVIAGVLTATVIAVTAFIFRNTILSVIKKIRPQMESKVPHVNFEVKEKKQKNGEWASTVYVSNASNEPAYNLYVHYFEQFMDDGFKITPSNAEDIISRPVLGIRDSLTFSIDSVKFEGCNVTCIQQIWVEYENSSGVNFRVVSEPPGPRGDIGRIRPPKVIKKRLELLPGAKVEGNARLARKIINGKATLLPEPKKIQIIKYNLYDRPMWKVRELLRKRDHEV